MERDHPAELRVLFKTSILDSLKTPNSGPRHCKVNSQIATLQQMKILPMKPSRRSNLY